MSEDTRAIEGDWAAFFGTEIEAVNPILRLIAAHEPGGPPAWLRGRHRFEHLPRVGPLPYAHRAGAMVGRGELAERVRFIVERCSGPWALSVSPPCFSFAQPTDLTLFVLRFASSPAAR